MAGAPYWNPHASCGCNNGAKIWEIVQKLKLCFCVRVGDARPYPKKRIRVLKKKSSGFFENEQIRVDSVLL